MTLRALVQRHSGALLPALLVRLSSPEDALAFVEAATRHGHPYRVRWEDSDCVACPE